MNASPCITFGMASAAKGAASFGSVLVSTSFLDLDYRILERYQSIVFLRPSSKFVFALNPNSLSALEVSSILLGCPLGFVLSQMISPLKLLSLIINWTKFFIEISKPVPRFTMSTHHQILIKEQARIFLIDSDSTHNGCQMDENIRPWVFIKFLTCLTIHKIIIFTSRYQDVSATFLF